MSIPRIYGWLSPVSNTAKLTPLLSGDAYNCQGGPGLAVKQWSNSSGFRLIIMLKLILGFVRFIDELEELR